MKLEEKTAETGKQIEKIVGHKVCHYRKTKETCGGCGKKEVYCVHQDLGAVDYYDNFWHVCLDCGDSKNTERHTCVGSESKEDTDCPYCGHRW